MSNAKGRRLKIMILEDEEDILILYKDYLSGRGHDVVSTYLTANNVLSEFGEKLPDICLVDYRLPGKTNGLEKISVLVKPVMLEEIEKTMTNLVNG
jgi:DNA-binding response OmpR family regulator